FFEIQFDHVTQVGTATRLAAATTATAKDVSKDVAENITQVVEALAAAVAAVVPVDAIVAELVVALALARITKDLVGLLDFLEALFSLRIIGIAVGMAFHGVPAEGLLQVRFAHRALHAQDFVVTPLAHESAPRSVQLDLYAKRHARCRFALRVAMCRISDRRRCIALTSAGRP